jgi:hypothetical protein
MTMDRSDITKPLSDLIEEMERDDDPVAVKLKRAREIFDRMRARAGLPPLAERDELPSKRPAA